MSKDAIIDVPHQTMKSEDFIEKKLKGLSLKDKENKEN